MAEHNDLGKEGEDEAVRYLTEKGYCILHRNWRRGRNELDIIATKDGQLVFVEVKTRRNETYGLHQEVRTRPPGTFRCNNGNRRKASLPH